MIKRKKQFSRRRVFSPQSAPTSHLESHFTGTLSMARSGNGFVSPTTGEEDIIIYPENLNGALPGDQVSVIKLPLRPSDTRPSGRVDRILERCLDEIVCTLTKCGSYLTAIPILPNYPHSFNITDPKNAHIGDRVIVRFSAWKNTLINPDGEITGVIGPAELPSLDTESIIKMYHLPGDFPPEVLQEAQHVSARLQSPGPREDLRDQFILTIDPESAKDFDDALSLEEDEEGHRILGVHIADVSHFVSPHSALDQEARQRGTSVYLVDKVIPMLPEQLSNGVCSLVPNEDRLTFSAFLTFNAAGVVIARRFTHSIIRSKLRLSYEQAQAILDHDPSAESIGSPEGCSRVLALHKLAQQLRSNRLKRFALDIASPEMQVNLDASGAMVGIHPAVHTPSHELVEEAMVAANEAVASEIASQHIPYISRFHDEPDPEKIAELSASVNALGLEVGDLMHTGNLARLLKAVQGTTLQYYVGMLVLRSMKRAEYTPEHEGHFGLSKRFYSHFTSPIRRYPDLVLHRQLSALLASPRAQQPSKAELERIAKSSTESEFRAEQASRDLIEIKKYRFLAEQLAQQKPLIYDAVIVKIMEFGVFVELPSLQVSGLVHVSTLSDQFVRYDRFKERLVAPGISLGAGDALKVLISGVNFDERKLDFSVVQFNQTRADIPQDLSAQSIRRRERRERRETKSSRGARGSKRPHTSDAAYRTSFTPKGGKQKRSGRAR